MNYYEFYSLPMTIEVDLTALKNAYYVVSRESHPDYHGQGNEEAQDNSLENSTYNNQAYRTLKDRDQRMKYLIEVIGEGKVKGEEKLDPMFLMEMMDLNEKMMDLKDEGVKELSEEVLKRDEVSYEALGDLRTKDVDTFDDKDWLILKNYYFQRRYLLRVINNLDKFADQ